MSSKYAVDALIEGDWKNQQMTDDQAHFYDFTAQLGRMGVSYRTTVLSDAELQQRREVDKLIEIKIAPARLDFGLLQTDKTVSTHKAEIKPNPPKPTVGRIVLYQSGDQTLAAIITQVGLLQHESRTPDVKLTIFWPDDAAKMPNGGWHVFSEELKGGYWSWPQRA
jgi:hypothetical protein